MSKVAGMQSEVLTWFAIIMYQSKSQHNSFAAVCTGQRQQADPKTRSPEASRKDFTHCFNGLRRNIDATFKLCARHNRPKYHIMY